MLLTGSVHHMTIVTLEQPGSEDPLQARSQPHRAPMMPPLPPARSPSLPSLPPSLPPSLCVWGWVAGRRGWRGWCGRRGWRSWVGCGEVGWGEVAWGRRLKLSSPRAAEALDWWAAMARVDAWRLVQDKKGPQLDAISQRCVAPCRAFPGTGPCLLQGRRVPPFSHSISTSRVYLYTHGYEQSRVFVFIVSFELSLYLISLTAIYFISLSVL